MIRKTKRPVEDFFGGSPIMADMVGIGGICGGTIDDIGGGGVGGFDGGVTGCVGVCGVNIGGG